VPAQSSDKSGFSTGLSNVFDIGAAVCYKER